MLRRQKMRMVGRWLRWRRLAPLALVLMMGLAGCLPAEQASPALTGRVVWAATPVADARVDVLGNAGEALATVIADAEGRFALETAPEGEFRLAAAWPDGAPNAAPITPVREGDPRVDVSVYLARELALTEPSAGDAVGTTPHLQWEALPEAVEYRVLIFDAGTTEIMLDVHTTDIELTVGPPLAPGHTYGWTVTAHSEFGTDASARTLLGSLTSEFRTASEVASSEAACLGALEQRELAEPYQRIDGSPRYTLSEAEWRAYLAEMGIADLCIPLAFGAPFVNADWDAASIPGATGRLISLGFERTYRGAGWSDAYVMLASYDAAFGSEYETFTTPEERDALWRGEAPGTITVADAVLGIVRLQPAEHGFGTRTLYRSYAFPFEDHYVALVYALGDYPADSNWEAMAEAILERADPPALQEPLAEMERLALSLRFTTRPDMQSAP